MNKQELAEIISNPLSTSEQKADAEKLLATTTDTDAEGFDWAAEMIAKSIRLFSSPEVRHQFFEREREVFKKDPNASRSFTPEREALRVKRNVYSTDGNRILGQAFDEDIEQFRKEQEGL